MTLAHLASSHVEAAYDFTFAHLSDGHAVGRWVLGSMDFLPGPRADVWHGVSLFDGSVAEVEIRPHPVLDLIDFHLDPKDDCRLRVTLGAGCGLDAQTCLVAMITWRGGWMTDDRWQRTCTTHDLEVLLFKAQIETDWGRQ